MTRANRLFYISVMMILIGMTSSETSSLEEEEEEKEEWVFYASVGDVAFLPCLAAAVVDFEKPGSWQHPSTTLINYPGDVAGNYEILLNSTLAIVSVTEDDFGLYHCYVANVNSEFQELIYSKALLEKIKTDDDLWQQYRTQLIVAAIAAACTLGLFIFIYLVYHFRYKEPKPERLDDKNVYPEFAYRNPSLVTEDEGTGRIKGYTPSKPIPEDEVNGTDFTTASTHL